MLFLELNLITDDIEFDWPIFVEICKLHKLGDRFGNSPIFKYEVRIEFDTSESLSKGTQPPVYI